jgi:hypothetical protein
MPSAGQVYDVCGDLYLDAIEKKVLLEAIEKYIGPPSAGKHWYSWKDELGTKHKGAAISDLEKARRDPVAWGVSNKCVPGRMRPSRPVRRAQESPPGPGGLSTSAVPEVLGTPEAEGAAADEAATGGDMGTHKDEDMVVHESALDGRDLHDLDEATLLKKSAGPGQEGQGAGGCQGRQEESQRASQGCRMGQKEQSTGRVQCRQEQQAWDQAQGCREAQWGGGCREAQ